MRHLFITLIATLFLVLSACVEEAPECDFEDNANCACDDGSTGQLQCNEDGTADCICDGGNDDEGN